MRGGSFLKSAFLIFLVILFFGQSFQQKLNPPEQKSCKILMEIPNGNSHLNDRWVITDNFLKYMHDDVSNWHMYLEKNISYLRIFTVKLQNLANFNNQNLFQISQKIVEQQKIILLLRSLPFLTNQNARKLIFTIRKRAIQFQKCCLCLFFVI